MLAPIPYLFFKGTCREAMEFYAEVLGAEIEGMLTGADAPPEHRDMMGDRNLVMHACIKLPGGGRIMASDSPGEYYEKPQGFAVSVHPTSVKEAERIFAAFAEGGKVTMPLQQTFWAVRFGTCVDRFGTPWMVNCEKDA